MNESGKQQCHPCSPGEYCMEGASAGLPCPSGRYQDLELAVMTSVGDCKVCPSGSFCSTGAAEPTACSPGTVQPLAEQGTCAKCDAGKYQHEQGETACFECVSGSYCEAGASAALPRPIMIE